jgi:hypothetical protein
MIVTTNMEGTGVTVTMVDMEDMTVMEEMAVMEDMEDMAVTEDKVVMAEAMMEAVTEEATARVSPPLPVMVVGGEEAATPQASPVLLAMGKSKQTCSFYVYRTFQIMITTSLD